MASYEAQYIYFLDDQGDGTYAIDDFGGFSDDQVISDNDGATSAFTVGELVYGSGLGDGQGIYEGYYQNGLFVQYQFTGDYYFYSNDTYSPGDIVTLNTASFAVCFMAGTKIACPEGERNIENVAVGDLVLTSDGQVKPVRWIGRQSIVSVFADPLNDHPICISAGALGNYLPVRDLSVSPDHALLLDGILVQAGALVNGTTIRRMQSIPARFTYFHIELDDHSLILAEGVPAETFIDNVTRRRFDNWSEHEALHPDGRQIVEMPYPRAKALRQIPTRCRLKLARPIQQREATTAF